MVKLLKRYLLGMRNSLWTKQKQEQNELLQALLVSPLTIGQIKRMGLDNYNSINILLALKKNKRYQKRQ